MSLVDWSLNDDQFDILCFQIIKFKFMKVVLLRNGYHIWEIFKLRDLPRWKINYAVPVLLIQGELTLCHWSEKVLECDLELIFISVH